MGQRTAPFVELARGDPRRRPGCRCSTPPGSPTPAPRGTSLAEGCADMVGMTRAHIADPHLVAKVARGEEDRIRPCVGAGYCIDRIYVGGDALCVHNPATGRERTMPHVDPRAATVRASAWSWCRRRAGRAGGRAGLGGARARGGAARGHRPAGRAGQPRRPARPPARDPGHHRLAAARGRAGRRGGPAEQLRRGRRRAGARRPTSWSSPPAACPTPASSARARTWSPAAGTCSRARSRSPARSWSTTRTASTRGRAWPSSWRRAGPR